MTTMLALLLAATVAQQPRTPARRPEPVTRSPANLAPSPNGTVAPQDPPPTNAYDSTLSAVVLVGRAVAEVKAELDRYLMTSRRQASGEVLESSQALHTRCQDLAAAARRAPRLMCRHCLSRQAQPAFDGYRAYLPSLSQVGDRCATTLQRMRGRDPESSVQKLKTQAHTVSEPLITGLRQYEAKLTPVRQALGGPPPRRG